jgi:3-isopropylmalate/(R)-2-methylmalate dehydratase large subunit
MPMTIAEKILSKHSGRDQVQPGEIIIASPDILLANDITAPLALKVLRELGTEKVFDPERVVLVADHFTPNRDLAAAEACAELRRFARRHNITHFYEAGAAGIEHALLPEQGLVLPGELVIGADSHTCTYGALGAFATGVGSTDFAVALKTGKIWLRVPPSIRITYTGRLNPWVGGKDLILYTISRLGTEGANYKAMEFFLGEGLTLKMSDRFTISNMAIEAGGKAGIFAPDRTTEEYLKDRARRAYTIFHSDRTAEYQEALEIDVSSIQPQVALPHSPANSLPVENAPEVQLDQVVIGSCTNGWIDDLRSAARVLAGNQVHPGTRLIIIPATPTIYRQALKEGLIETFLNASAVIAPPSCGPCLGGHLGVLAEGERALATTNRNFPGRMGHANSYVYLSSPAVAAASALTGRITHPQEIISELPEEEAP